MKIVISGNYGANNLGDELILQGFIQFLREINPKFEITVLSAQPKQTAEKYQVQSHNKFPAGIRSTIKYLTGKKTQARAVKEANLFILGGGGLFSNLHRKANSIWKAQAKQAIKHNIPLFILGQSLDTAKTAYQRKTIKEVFQKAEFISLRDKKSQKILKEIIDGQSSHYCPDFALHIKEPKLDTPQEQQRALICLRQMENLPSNFQTELLKCLNDLQNRNWHLEFLDFKRPNDTKFHHEIISQLKSQQNISHHKNIEGIVELKEHYQAASVVIAMRLHSVIAAIKFQRPFVALNYAEKIQNFLVDQDLSSQVLDLDKIEQLKEKIFWTAKNSEQISHKLKSAIHDNSEGLQSFKLLLKHKLETL
jgi:polysaccharide pyruvyl transferase CsaB